MPLTPELILAVQENYPQSTYNMQGLPTLPHSSDRGRAQKTTFPSLVTQTELMTLQASPRWNTLPV